MYNILCSLKINCPGGGIGRHAGLRSQCASVTVRVRPGAPDRDCGEIGRHKRLKISRRKSYQFDSGQSHQVLWRVGRAVKATVC